MKCLILIMLLMTIIVETRKVKSKNQLKTDFSSKAKYFNEDYNGNKNWCHFELSLKNPKCANNKEVSYISIDMKDLNNVTDFEIERGVNNYKINLYIFNVKDENKGFDNLFKFYKLIDHLIEKKLFVNRKVRLYIQYKPIEDTKFELSKVKKIITDNEQALYYELKSNFG